MFVYHQKKEIHVLIPNRSTDICFDAPHFLVGDREQALAFYEQLGFATTYHDEGFTIVERDGIALHFTVSDPTQEPPKGRSVCWIGRHHYRGM